MTPPEPINIDLLTFIKTGKFDYIKLGQTKEWIIENFPDPDDTYQDNYNSPIWFYGNIEFHFHEDEKLFLIYSDYIDTLDGRQSLRLQKWIFDEPDKLTLDNVIRHLTKERVDFKIEYRTLSTGDTTAILEIIASHVNLSFALPENDDEGYEQYLQKLKDVDSNLFRLYSFSLTTG